MDVVGEMGEPSRRAGEIGGEGNRFGDAHVCGVRGEAEGIDDEHVEVLHEIAGGFRNGLYVAHVSDAFSFDGFEKETGGLGVTMKDRQGSDAGLSEEKGRYDGVWVGVKIARAAVFIIEGVMKC